MALITFSLKRTVTLLWLNQKLRHYPCKRQVNEVFRLFKQFLIIKRTTVYTLNAHEGTLLANHYGTAPVDIEATGSNLTEKKLLARTDSAVVEA